MKNFYLIFIFTFSFAQESETLHLNDSVHLNADAFWGVDAFDAIYYSLDNTLYKKTDGRIFSYKNTALSQISSIDFLNPLEITLFYKDFNSVIQLDNRFSELKNFNFNTSLDYKTISHASTASNHRLWVFNEITNQIEIFSFTTRNKEQVTQPITEKVIQIRSNYNYCWVLTASGILVYNNYGNLINQYDLADYQDFVKYRGFLFLRKNNKLVQFEEATGEIKYLNCGEILIKDFSVINETLYIYDGKKLELYPIHLKE